MTLEELRVEAEKLGYKLVKIPEKVKLSPCPVCGSKHTSVWYIGYSGINSGQFRRCDICDFKGKTVAKGELATKKAWNEAVEEYLREENDKRTRNLFHFLHHAETEEPNAET